MSAVFQRFQTRPPSLEQVAQEALVPKIPKMTHLDPWTRKSNQGMKLQRNAAASLTQQELVLSLSFYFRSGRNGTICFDSDASKSWAKNLLDVGEIDAAGISEGLGIPERECTAICSQHNARSMSPQIKIRINVASTNLIICMFDTLHHIFQKCKDVECILASHLCSNSVHFWTCFFGNLNCT